MRVHEARELRVAAAQPAIKALQDCGFLALMSVWSRLWVGPCDGLVVPVPWSLWACYVGLFVGSICDVVVITTCSFKCLFVAPFNEFKNFDVF